MWNAKQLKSIALRQRDLKGNYSIFGYSTWSNISNPAEPIKYVITTERRMCPGGKLEDEGRHAGRMDGHLHVIEFLARAQ